MKVNHYLLVLFYFIVQDANLTLVAPKRVGTPPHFGGSLCEKL